MKNKILKITVIMLITIIFMQISVFANTLTLDIKTNKGKIETGEKFKVTVSWDQGMQAADFYLKYDSTLLEFIKADIEEDFINSETEGKVKTAWFSMDDTDKTEITYTFKAKKNGTVELKTEINGGFATGELKIPEDYKEGNLTLEIVNQPLIKIILKIVLILAVVFIVIKTVVSKFKNKKTNIKKYFK